MEITMDIKMTLFMLTMIMNVFIATERKCAFGGIRMGSAGLMDKV